jgi:hypothetical protein
MFFLTGTQKRVSSSFLFSIKYYNRSRIIYLVDLLNGLDEFFFSDQGSKIERLFFRILGILRNVTMMRTIGLAQLTSTNDLEENFRNCEKIAQLAQKQNVKLLCFPGTKYVASLDEYSILV